MSLIVIYAISQKRLCNRMLVSLLRRVEAICK